MTKKSDTAQFIDFISASPSSYHAADQVAQHLQAAGFCLQLENESWDSSPGGHVMVRGGAVVAWFVPEKTGESTGFRIIGSHTDSPGFSLKPTPDFYTSGWQQLAVEVYGGPILHSWFDRELTVAGQLVLKDGARQLVNSGPLVRIPNLAIHLHRQNEFKPDRQTHIQPIVDTAGGGAESSSILQALCEPHGIESRDIAAFNLITADSQPGQEFGSGQRFIAAGRMDNLSSVHASLQALLRASAVHQGEDILVLAAFDHEEVGSNSRYGASGPLLTDVLERTALALGMDADQRYRAYAQSSCVSADAAHSVHPNYAGKHDPTHLPIIGRGPVTKINGNQRYASDAVSIARWEAACADAGVAIQRFVGNNEVPCGSTIGPLTATRLGIDTVDVGVPMLSMHSARELIGADDQLSFNAALEAYLRG